MDVSVMNWMELPGNGWDDLKCWKWLETSGNDWKWIEMAEMAEMLERARYDFRQLYRLQIA